MKKTVHPQQTICEMTQIVMPSQANSQGTVFGGQIMAWIDICAAVSAQRFARGSVVTASMDHLTFEAPIRQGHVVVLRSMVNWAGTTSIEVGVRVEGEDPMNGDRTHTSSAYLTFVALGEDGAPREVPTLLPQSPEEKERQHAAQERRTDRLTFRDSSQYKRNGK